ncbi:cuticle protein 19.8-like [Belonocnema kinseyi]|uniref:cuticle protein 19.8-like n=1 Tax=Belonocnema kinseyi TaxID=2817044 RepID=UPI00143DD843|nr:cuticle protein 19.8-like [Belonocnema kinseyi]
MAFKFVVLAALVAVANAGAIGAPLSYAAPAHLAYASAPAAYAQPIAKAVVAKTVDTEFDPHPQYSYAYDVQDGLTGDSKGQHETRDGDIVHGSYNLLEADGTRRVVDYTADPVNGFNAVVRKEPAAVAVKAVAAAPVIKAVAHAPVAYAAPQYAQYAAPAVAAAPALYAAPALSYSTPAQLAYASAPVAYAQPIAKAVVAKTVDTEFDPHPQYSYAYDVQDGLTGDSKGQHETREGDVVHGSYNLLEADGTRRIVDYTADPVNGFNAVVRKEPAAVAVKAVAAAPVVKAVAHAPVAYAAPQYAQYAAPAVAAAPALYAAPAQYAPVVKTVSHAPIVAQPALQYAHAPVAYASAPHYGYAAAPAYYH